MHDEDKAGASTNTEGKHVHTPEDGGHPDDALAPGNHSGSGDVEYAQRRAVLPPDTPIKGGPSREPTANQPQPGLPADDTLRGGDVPSPGGAPPSDAPDPRVVRDDLADADPQPPIGEDVRGDATARDLGVREPEGDSKQQLERIQERNRALVEEDAEPGPEGERETGVGQTVRSEPSQTGDYSSD